MNATDNIPQTTTDLTVRYLNLALINIVAVFLFNYFRPSTNVLYQNPSGMFAVGTMGAFAVALVLLMLITPSTKPRLALCSTTIYAVTITSASLAAAYAYHNWWFVLASCVISIAAFLYARRKEITKDIALVPLCLIVVLQAGAVFASITFL